MSLDGLDVLSWARINSIKQHKNLL